MADVAGDFVAAADVFDEDAVTPDEDAFFLANFAQGADEAPVIENVDPAPGSTLRRSDAWSFRVRDPAGALVAVSVGVSFRDGGAPEENVYWVDQFLPRYAGSTRTIVNASTWDFTIVRAGGWPAAPRFFPVSVDSGGNLNA